MEKTTSSRLPSPSPHHRQPRRAAASPPVNHNRIQSPWKQRLLRRQTRGTANPPLRASHMLNLTILSALALPLGAGPVLPPVWPRSPERRCWRRRSAGCCSRTPEGSNWETERRERREGRHNLNIQDASSSLDNFLQVHVRLLLSSKSENNINT